MKSQTQLKRIIFVGVFMIGLIGILKIFPFHVLAEHVHDETCGYVEEKEGHACEHVHDEQCGYVEAREEIPCDQGCVDTDGDGIINHSIDCAYQPAVEGRPCQHIHDNNCGYVAAVEGHPCQYVQQVQRTSQNITVTTFDELQDEIKNATGTIENPTVISLGGQTILADEGINLMSHKHIVIENGTLEIISDDIYYAFSISPESTLALRHLTVDGKSKSVSAVFYQLGKLTLDDGATIQNFACRSAVIYGDGNGTPESLTEIKTGSVMTACTLPKQKPYISLQYSAKVHLMGGLLNGPGIDMGNPGIQCTSTAETLDIIVDGGTIQNFSSGISTSDHAVINDVVIKNVDVGIDINALSEESTVVDFKGGTITDCVFAAVRLQQGTFQMSGGLITRCTSDPKYLDFGAIYMMNGKMNLTGGKIKDNFACGIDSAGGYITLSGDTFEISGNKIGIKTSATKELNLLGGKIINNDDGVYISSANPKVNLGGSVLIEENKDGDLYVPEFNARYNNIQIVQDFTDDAHVSLSILSPLAQGTELQVALPSDTYHGGQLIGDETDHFACSETQYQLVIKDNKLTMLPEGKATVQFKTYHSQTIENQEVVLGSKITEPQTLVKSGYIFEGWYKDETCLQKWNFDVDVVTSSLTLYAKWNPIEYHLIYQLQGGVNANGNPACYTIESDDIVIKVPTQDGYTFKGWTYEGQNKPMINLTIPKGSIGDKTLTANWEINHYNVTFHTNGGSTIQSQIVDYNHKVVKPSDPIKENYQFLGWYSDQALTNEYDFASSVTTSFDLYAKYRPLNRVNKVTSNVSDENRILKGTKIELSSSTSDAMIYYTIDGSEPTYSSLRYNGPITIQQETTIKAKAIKIGMDDSVVSTFHYQIKEKIMNPVSSHSSGVISRRSQNMTLSCATPQAIIKYTLDGSNPQTNGQTYINGQIIKINKETTLKMYATMNDPQNYLDSDVVTYTYTMMPQVAKPTSSLNNETIDKGTKVSLMSETTGAQIYYTVDGTLPNQNSQLYKAPIVLNESMTIKAIAMKEGMDDSEIVQFHFTVKKEGNVEVVIKVEGEGNITVGDQKDILRAVLNDKDYQQYQKGNDIVITLECQLIDGKKEIIDENVVKGYHIGKYLDISVYKQIGNQTKEKVTELNQPIQLVIDIPDELLPDTDVKRTYSVLRIHNSENTLLTDQDQKLETITIETHKFSTYVILYQDEKNQNGMITTHDDTQYFIYCVLSVVSLVTMVTIKRKSRYKHMS